MFGNYVKQKRIENKLTLRDFVKLIDMDVVLWSKIERSIEPPIKHTVKLKKISEVLDIDYPTLLTLADAPFHKKEEDIPIPFLMSKKKFKKLMYYYFGKDNYGK